MDWAGIRLSAKILIKQRDHCSPFSQPPAHKHTFTNIEMWALMSHTKTHTHTHTMFGVISASYVTPYTLRKSGKWCGPVQKTDRTHEFFITLCSLVYFNYPDITVTRLKLSVHSLKEQVIQKKQTPVIIYSPMPMWSRVKHFWSFIAKKSKNIFVLGCCFNVSKQASSCFSCSAECCNAV